MLYVKYISIKNKKKFAFQNKPTIPSDLYWMQPEHRRCVRLGEMFPLEVTITNYSKDSHFLGTLLGSLHTKINKDWSWHHRVGSTER